MSKAQAATTKVSRKKIVIIASVVAVLIASAVTTYALFRSDPDYAQLCIDDQIKGRMTDEKLSRNCEKALELERQKGCESMLVHCEGE